MASRLRKRQIIPKETSIRATLTDPKIVHGRFGRQVEAMVNVTRGGDDNEYRGTTFKTWFSFGKDQETGEEYISYGGPLYQMLSLVEPDLDKILEDEDLSDREYEKHIKKAVKALDDLDILAKTGVKFGKENPERKSNILLPGTIGPYLDSEADEGFEDLSMGDSEAAAEEKAPF
jgi:hypothetical protein